LVYVEEPEVPGETSEEARKRRNRNNTRWYRYRHPNAAFETNQRYKEKHPNGKIEASKRYLAKPGNRERHNALANGTHGTEEGKAAQAKRNRDRRRTDPGYALIVLARSNEGAFLSGKDKSASTEELMGCTKDELAAHIESLWELGMTWENRGWASGCDPYWEVDHVRPLKTFNFEDPKHQRAACHYTNKRPLWMRSNRSRKLGRVIDWSEWDDVLGWPVSGATEVTW
jgi:hypothetical protein